MSWGWLNPCEWGNSARDFVEETVEIVKVEHHSGKIGRAMADHSMTLPESDDSWLRLADRYGVKIEYEEDFEQFKSSVDAHWCEQMIDNGIDEAEDNGPGFISKAVSWFFTGGQ